MRNQKLRFALLVLSITVLGCTKNKIVKPAPAVPLDETYHDGASYTSADLPPGDTIKSFSTSWIVPSTPPRDSTIFWWNGLDRGALQPVLQWENGSWTIANWYFNNGNYHHGKFVPVAPGTQLTGVIELISFTTDSFTYKESFVGYPAADVTFKRSTLATGLVECQEAYTNTYLAFPSDSVVRMTGISCTTTRGTHPPDLHWTVRDPLTKTPTGRLAFEVINPSSSNGEIDFFIR